MNTRLILMVAALFVAWVSSPSYALAQTEMPPPSGEVSGKIFNQNQGRVITESLEIMLHIWDKDYVDIDMLHAQSAPEGTFRFTSVALQPQYLYAVMAVFEDVAYFSNITSLKDDSNRLELDVSVYETTKDSSAVQVDQLHVLFNFAEDGLETSEIYLLSNMGQRTVKDAVKLEDGTLASLRYPLPADADFIFFQPTEENRFIKFPGGFADTSPLLPGGQIDRYTVKYLVPFSQGQTYSYTAPLNIKTMNFLLPEGTGVSLDGNGLTGPQPVTLEGGASFIVYSFGDIPAGQTIKVTFSGKPVLGSRSQTNNQNLPLALGGGLLGLVMVGVGVWWRFRPEDVEDEDGETDADTGESTFDDLVTQIARMDEAFERGELGEGKYHEERRYLRQLAKSMMDQQNRY